MSVIECSWQIPYSISGIKIELLSTQSLLRIWTYWVLNDSIEKMQLLSTQFQLRIWTYWVLNIEYSISTTFLGAIEYSINPILSEHYHNDMEKFNTDPSGSLLGHHWWLWALLTPKALWGPTSDSNGIPKVLL